MHTIIPADENPALREIARDVPISEIAEKPIQGLIADMRTLLSKEEYGVALAAPQVGKSLKIFVISGEAIQKRNKKYGEGKSEDDQPIRDAVYINPTLEKVSRKKLPKHEGCLSIRGKWGIVPRAEKCTIHAWDEAGKEFTRGASGLLAHIFQHEMDHLEGILYPDKATNIYDDKETTEE